MLLHLVINNIATIQHIELDFEKGFSILTGETGAGKSIIIDAIHIITGKKADYSLIRSGESQASVEAVFDISALSHVQHLLNEADIPFDSELIIRRILQQNNRQKILINDTTVTRMKLEEIGNLLVTIHGQHDNQILLQASSHLDFLDGFGQLLPLRQEVEEHYEKHQSNIKAYKNFKKNEERKKEKLEELSLIQSEIVELNLQSDEEETLAEESQILNHAEKLSFIFKQAQNDLYDREGSILEKMEVLVNDFKDAEKFDNHCIEMRKTLENCFYQIEDLQHEINTNAAKYQENPERLEWINQRLSQIQSLKRKYGSSIPEILEYLSQINQELEQLQNTDESESTLHKQIISSKKELHEKSKTLSNKRQKSAKELNTKVIHELHQLGMEKAIFKTQVTPSILITKNSEGFQYSPTGVDFVEFLLSVNPGQELKSLIKVASGGELSRIMLALKTVLISLDPVQTMIFDEIDLGISGRVAEIVGLKLRSLSEGQQALCVTHLPQIAAFSQQHYSILKKISNNTTLTTIRVLNQDEKVEELARLMGGIEVTQQTLDHASEMLERTREKVN